MTSGTYLSEIKTEEKIYARKLMALYAKPFGKLAERSISDLTAYNTFFDEKQLDTYLSEGVRRIVTPEDKLKLTPGGVNRASMYIASQIRQEMTSHPDLCPAVERDGKKLFTAPDLIQAEQDIIDAATRMSSRKIPYFREDQDLIDIADDFSIFWNSAQGLSRSKELDQAMASILEPGDLRLINGPPGAGKSGLCAGVAYCMLAHMDTPPSFITTAPSDKAAAAIHADVQFAASALDDKWPEQSQVQGMPLKDLINRMNEGFVEPGTVLGKVTAEASRETGIPEGLPVVAAGSDKGCETVGTGAIYNDVASISFGTTATIQLTTEEYVEPEKFLPAYPAVYPGKYNPETIVYRGYWMLRWFLDEFARRQGEELTEKDFDKMLPEIPAGSDGLTVEPYWSPSLKRAEALGAILGFRERHTVFHIYRAIIEGINFALLEGLKCMEKRAKTKVERVTVSGGGAQSDEVCQITADMFGVPVFRVQTYETSGLGAAICTFVGLGVYPDYDAAIHNMVKISKVFKPSKEIAARYARIYNKVYAPAYGRVKPIYKRIKKLKKGEVYV